MLRNWLPLLQPRVRATLSLSIALLLPCGGLASALAQTSSLPHTTIAPTETAPTRSRSDAKTPQRAPAPALSSLPPPKASGPRRILLVDDDWSENNHPRLVQRRLSESDQV